MAIRNRQGEIYFCFFEANTKASKNKKHISPATNGLFQFIICNFKF